MAKKETFSRGTKVGYLGRPGKMGSTRNDYNQVDTSYLLHNFTLLEKKNFSEFIGHLFEKIGEIRARNSCQGKELYDRGLPPKYND